MLVKKFLTDPTIDHKGKVLDVGFGNGNDSLSLARAGYVVEAIDKSKEQVEEFSKKTKGKSIRVLEKDVCNLVLNEHTYSVIVASNVLFFIDDKEKVLALIDNFIKALCSGGYLLFSLLGPEDSWKERENMSFFEYEEVLGFLESKNIEYYFRSTEEGYGLMMSGETKYWHMHRFIIKK